MIRSKTLFIVGAGASTEVGLPDGEELKNIISRQIDIQFDGFYRQVSGDYEIMKALSQHVREENGGNGDANPYLLAGWTIRDAMPLAISVDNFLDAHQHDDKIQLCGKLAIVKSILKAERESKLYHDIQNGGTLDLGSVGDTWLLGFRKLLTEGIIKNTLEDIFNNTTFIVFNYDRCIEHYLVHDLRTYYNLKEEDAIRLTQKLKILRPYGSVGPLPWQNPGRGGVPFGSTNTDLLSIASQIKTFNEKITDVEALNNLRQAYEEAETIVFLGFAFHEQNMELLVPNQAPTAKRIFGTVYGISSSDRKVILQQLAQLMKHGSLGLHAEIASLKCTDLFKQYGRSLTSA